MIISSFRPRACLVKLSNGYQAETIVVSDPPVGRTTRIAGLFHFYFATATAKKSKC
jgi:hypothetical protein